MASVVILEAALFVRVVGIRFCLVVEEVRVFDEVEVRFELRVEACLCRMQD